MRYSVVKDRINSHKIELKIALNIDLKTELEIELEFELKIEVNAQSVYEFLAPCMFYKSF